MRIERRSTRAGSSPYDGLSFVQRELPETSGDPATTMTVPESWSSVATDVLARKYARRAGVPGKGGETDARELFHRLAGCWAHWAEKLGYLDKTNAETFYDELCFDLARQRAAPNSPQWFNTGLHFAYGITGTPQGHWYVDAKTEQMHEATSAYERPQPHACFIQSVRDDLVGPGGIFDLLLREARLFKFGSGSGTNFSNLRGRGEPLASGGVSSGVLSFLQVSDRAAAVIRSGGTARRAAKMVCLDIDHPEIEDFIDWKVREEEKVAALVAGSSLVRSGTEAEKIRFVPGSYLDRVAALAEYGATEFSPLLFDLHWLGEAYATVSGQNANHTVRVSDEFFRALERSARWPLKRRGDGSIARTVPAVALWGRMARAAWACADPGIQYSTTIDEWHTCPAGGEIYASNPCSEYLFLDDTACNLASINLLSFYDTATDRFDVEAFRHSVRLWTLVLEVSVAMAQYPGREVAQKSYEYRTIGLGFANLGALLMSMGLAYDSEKGRAVAGALTAILTGESYATSSEIAEKMGPFPRYAENRESMLRVLRNHRRAAHGAKAAEYEGLTRVPRALDAQVCPKELLEAARKSWDRALMLAEKHGVRNAQATAIAPTGTIALVMDCDTTGIEPDYSLVKLKDLAFGGKFDLTNKSVPVALRRLGYAPAEVEKIVAHVAAKGTAADAPGLKPEHLPVFTCAVAPPGSKAPVLSAEAHLHMLAAVQPFVSGGISKTLNLPAHTSPDAIAAVYLTGWKLGLKALALYRDGSKLSQPLAAKGGLETHLREAGACPECS